MKKKNLKKLKINKDYIISLNTKIVGGELPTTGQNTVEKRTKDPLFCWLTPAICQTNKFDC